MPHLILNFIKLRPRVAVADVRRGVWLLRKARVRQERGQQESVDLSVLCLVPGVPLRTADCLFPDLRG